MPVKSVFAPHLNRFIRFGRVRPQAGPRLYLKDYFKDLPTPPTTISYSQLALPALRDVYGNDQLGDCVIAGGYHAPVATATGNAGNLFHATNAQILADYGAIGGYVPGDPNTDNGCDEVTAMNYWKSHGFADGTKVAGWFNLDPTNQQEIMQALWLFENLYFGIELPDAWISPFPSADNFVWDVAGNPDPSNGHCIVGVAADSKGVIIDTWGMFGYITWAAIAKYCAPNSGELHVMITPDQINKASQKAPNGFDWPTLIADANAMGANIPAPAPTPNPQPVPVPPAPVPNPQPVPVPPDPNPTPNPPPAPNPSPDPLEPRVAALEQFQKDFGMWIQGAPL